MMAGERGSGFRRWRALGAALLEERRLVAAPCITERKRFHKVPSGAVRPPEQQDAMVSDGLAKRIRSYARRGWS